MKKHSYYDPHARTRNKVIDGAVNVTKIVVGGAVFVGALGMLGNMFRRD